MLQRGKLLEVIQGMSTIERPLCWYRGRWCSACSKSMECGNPFIPEPYKSLALKIMVRASQLVEDVESPESPRCYASRL